MATALLLTSCKKEEKTTSADELVFGNFYGFCVDDCFNAFGINGQQLQRDTATHYLYNYLNYNFTGHITLHDSLHQQFSSLLSSIPAELFNHTEKTYGCPDCHDQGGVYVELNRDGVKRRFSIDNDSTSDQSPEIIAFKEQVRNAANVLREL